MPHIIEEKLIATMVNIQIQFHLFVPDAQHQRDEIMGDSLGKTHKEDWCYYFVWEGWSLK